VNGVLCKFDYNGKVYYGDSTTGFCSTFYAGLNDLSEQIDYSYSPNPAQDHVSIHYVYSGIPASVTIYDAMGVTMEERIISGDESIDMRRYPSGLYVFAISRAHRQRSLFKIVKL
jgi:hypothetical protein